MSTRRSSRRQQQAAATRQDILAAARRLFASKGYAATSMAAIAKEADTAVQTIYDSVGSKGAIILALVATIEEEAGVGPFREKIAHSQDPRETLGLYVSLTRQFMERCGDVNLMIQTAAATEPDVGAAWQAAKRNHGFGATFVAGRLASMDALRADLTLERAATTVAVLCWSTTWRQFTEDHGWTFDATERWMVETLTTLLLRDAV